MLVRADGAAERLTSGGPVLGVFAEAAYEHGTVSLARGDRLVLFTDGITEARNASDEEFGEERLLDLIVRHRASPAAALQTHLADAVGVFAAQGLQDDATLIVLGSG